MLSKKFTIILQFVFISILFFAFGLQAQDTFTSNPLPNEITGHFLLEYDAIPLGENIDGVFAVFKTDSASSFDDNAILIRFNDSGVIDCRTGGGDAHAVDVPNMDASTSHLTVAATRDPTSGSSGSYSVWVTPPGGYETLIAAGYDFRTAQANVDTLKNYGLWLQDGVEAFFTVSNVEMPNATFSTVPFIPSLTNSMMAITDSFAIEFDAVPQVDTMDYIMTLSKLEQQTQWNDCAVLVAFNPDGVFHARNGDAYEKLVDVPYLKGESYHIKIAGKLDPANGGKYSVWVTPEGGATTQIAQDYGFRTAQANVDTLLYFGDIITNVDEWSPGGYATVTNVYVSYQNNTPDIYDEWFFDSVPLGVSLTDSFVVEADAVAGADNIDCGFTILKSDNPTEFNDNAVLVSFNTDGVFHARNGGGYEKIAEVPYQKHKTYHIKVTGSVPNSTYSVWITDPEGTETLIAENYQFRTAQIGVDTLKNWGRFFAGMSGYAEFSNVVVEAIGGGTGINSDQPNIAKSYKLEQNYPNPFNPTTKISYTIPEKSHVCIKVYNMLGEHIITLVNRNLSAGNYSIKWNARDKFGNQVASGMYVYQIVAGDFVNCKKMVLLR